MLFLETGQINESTEFSMITDCHFVCDAYLGNCHSFATHTFAYLTSSFLSFDNIRSKCSLVRFLGIVKGLHCTLFSHFLTLSRKPPKSSDNIFIFQKSFKINFVFCGKKKLESAINMTNFRFISFSHTCENDTFESLDYVL